MLCSVFVYIIKVFVTKNKETTISFSLTSNIQLGTVLYLSTVRLLPLSRSVESPCTCLGWPGPAAGAGGMRGSSHSAEGPVPPGGARAGSRATCTPAPAGADGDPAP